MKKKAYILVFEGVDGIGKGTLMFSIKKYLETSSDLKQANIKIYNFQQPRMKAKKEISTIDKTNWLRLLYLFMKDREAQYIEEIEPLLTERCIILMDRYYHSSCVYQSLVGEVDPVEIFHAHGPWAIKPDLTIICDSELATIEQRLQKRNLPLENLEGDLSYLLLIQNRYRDLVRCGYSEFDECVLVDAGGTPQEVVERCLFEIKPFLSKVLASEGTQ